MFRLSSLFVVFMVPLCALKPVGHVNDFAGVFSAGFVEQMEQRLEKREGMELAIVTVPSVGEVGVEAFAREVFDSWGIGKKGEDSGVLFLVAMGERAVRIEVGYGLEGVLPDGVCGRLIREVVAPAFASGEYERGTSELVEALAARVDGKEVVASDEWIFMAVALGVFGLYAFLYLLSRSGYAPGLRRVMRRMHDQSGYHGGWSSRGGGGFGGFGGGSGGGGGASGRF